MSLRAKPVELDLPFDRTLPDRLRPMLPMPAAAAFDSAEYIFEVAWSGVRAMASFEAGRVTLWGRDLTDLTSRYPEVDALKEMTPADSIVDGELIVTDVDGRPDPSALQEREHATTPAAIARAVAATSRPHRPPHAHHAAGPTPPAAPPRPAPLPRSTHRGSAPSLSRSSCPAR